MALMDGTYYLLAVLSLALSLFSRFNTQLAYVAAALLVVMFVILVWSIPLKLNWSSNLYGHLLLRFLGFLAFMLIVYAICYYNAGFERVDGTRPNFLEAIYFSVSSFTTVEYGQYVPFRASQFLVSLESLMAPLAFVPFFTSFGWLYCQNRLRPQSQEDMATPKGLALSYDSVVGGWRELPNERTKAEAEELKRRVTGIPCSRCGSTEPKIDKFYDIIGRTSPLALYVIHCSCGQIAKPSTTAFLAAWRWRQLNKKPRQQPKKQGVREGRSHSIK